MADQLWLMTCIREEEEEWHAIIRHYNSYNKILIGTVTQLNRITLNDLKQWRIGGGNGVTAPLV